MQSIEKLDNHAEYQYYQELLKSHPIDIFMVGPNLDVLANMFARLEIPRSDLTELQTPVQKEAGEPRFHEERMEVQQSVLMMGYRTNLRYLDEKYYALIVCNGILGGFPHSKLFMNVRERASLAYYVGSNLEGTKGIMTINAGIDGAKVDEATKIIQQQLEDMKNGNITQNELDQTKRGLCSSISSMSDDPTSVIDRNLIGLVNGEMRSFDDVLTAIEQVSLAEVQEVANRLQLDTVYVLRGKTERE